MGWKYTAEMRGEYDTRHEAIGAAAIAAGRQRRARDRVLEELGSSDVPPGPSVLEATERVYAYKPHQCGYCYERFLTEEAESEHQPCPQWVADGRPGGETADG